MSEDIQTGFWKKKWVQIISILTVIGLFLGLTADLYQIESLFGLSSILAWILSILWAYRMIIFLLIGFGIGFYLRPKVVDTSEPVTDKMQELENIVSQHSWYLDILKNCLSPISFLELQNRHRDPQLAVWLKRLQNLGGIARAYAAIGEGLKTRKIKFVPLFFNNPSSIKSPLITATNGVNFTNNYKEGLENLLSKLVEFESTFEDPNEIIAKIENIESSNPFRRIRAEVFHDDYELMAKLFAEPEKEKYEMIKENSSGIVFGGRGSGKTMILKSLTPELIMEQNNISDITKLFDHNVNYFGVYNRLTRGCLFNHDYNFMLEVGYRRTGIERKKDDYKIRLDNISHNIDVEKDPVISAGMEAAWNITLNELNFKVIINMINKLIIFQEAYFIKISRLEEKTLISDIMKLLNNDPCSNFPELIDYFESQLRKINIYVQKTSIPDSKADARARNKPFSEIFLIFIR